ncbi:hypothetical protein MRB53_002231 [Persea americana]|uniref:Uncharacterized protein n=1 Tax=Persea americana TaxID=3435 RepID=A0ACC2MU86_PERAE|nr:hypothetical protein MRB53_002231 [Persea americana]
MTQEARAKNPGSKKISTMRENLKEFFADTNAIYSDIALRRDLAFYLTYWLGEVVFAGGDGTHIRPQYIFPACQMAFGERLALVPTFYSYLCIELQAATFLVRLGLAMNRGVVGAPSSKVKRFGGLQDGRNGWAFYRAEDTTAMISYPELPTFQIAGFTKWFMESFSVHQGLSKKELDVKQSSAKGLGKSDGFRREEVLAFLSGEKHKIGFLDDRDVIRSGAVQEMPGKVLE